MDRASLPLLTHSRMQTFKTCARKHYLAYELGVCREEEAAPLRMGQAFHIGRDYRSRGASVDEAILQATKGYLLIPHYMEPEEWELEREIVARLLAAYYWRYDGQDYETVASELSFQLPLLNPETGRESRTWMIAGIIDAIIRLSDGRLALLETKTTSDDLSSDSEYWQRLRLDQQISLYVLAARRLGHDVQTVVYDVIRKPAIRPKQITKLAAREIQFAKTYCKEAIAPAQLSLDKETPAMFGARLLSDIAERPDWYFCRKEIPRLENELDEFAQELWQQGKMIQESRLNGYWFRNSASCLHPPCEYRSICFQGLNLHRDSELPPGFVKVQFPHRELEGRFHVNGHENATQASAAPTPGSGDVADQWHTEKL